MRILGPTICHNVIHMIFFVLAWLPTGPCVSIFIFIRRVSSIIGLITLTLGVLVTKTLYQDWSVLSFCTCIHTYICWLKLSHLIGWEACHFVTGPVGHRPSWSLAQFVTDPVSHRPTSSEACKVSKQFLSVCFGILRLGLNTFRNDWNCHQTA